MLSLVTRSLVYLGRQSVSVVSLTGSLGAPLAGDRGGALGAPLAVLVGELTTEGVELAVELGAVLLLVCLLEGGAILEARDSLILEGFALLITTLDLLGVRPELVVTGLLTSLELLV